MDWNSLLSAIVGGLLTVIPVLITIRNQAKERDKERREQRREAKTQLALELMRNDIRVLENAIDNQLNGLGEIIAMRQQHVLDEKSDSEVIEDIKTKLSSGKYWKLMETDRISYKLALALGEEIFSEYCIYDDAIFEYFRFLLVAIEEDERKDESAIKVMTSAGKLHNMLNDKLISLRDT
jgi:hypothetical protein